MIQIFALAFGAGAFTQQLNIATFDALASGQQFGASLAQCLIDQPVVTATAVRFEVGKPGVGLCSASRLKRRLSPSKTGRNTEPVDVIVGSDCLIAGPGFVIGGLTGVVQTKPVFLMPTCRPLALKWNH
jgi:hypothetical protein